MGDPRKTPNLQHTLIATAAQVAVKLRYRNMLSASAPVAIVVTAAAQVHHLHAPAQEVWPLLVSAEVSPVHLLSE